MKSLVNIIMKSLVANASSSSMRASLAAAPPRLLSGWWTRVGSSKHYHSSILYEY